MAGKQALVSRSSKANSSVVARRRREGGESSFLSNYNLVMSKGKGKAKDARNTSQSTLLGFFSKQYVQRLEARSAIIAPS